MTKIKLPHDHSALDPTDWEKIPDIGNFQTVSDIFKQLGDSSRLRIFWILCHCEECVINISALVDMSSPAVSHHLKLLKDAGLIDSRRDGKEVYYKAVDNEKARLLHQMIEDLMEIACPTGAHPGRSAESRES